MRNQWVFNSEGLTEHDISQLDGMDKLQQLPITVISRDRSSYIGYYQLDKLYYIKFYLDDGSSFRQLFKHSRFYREHKNLMLFNQLGINTPRMIAYGKRLGLLKLKHGVIVTEGLSNCATLLELGEQHLLYDKGRAWLRNVLKQVALFTRRLHDAGFVHVDLKWRNILVDKASGKVFFIDCPSGHYPPAWLKQHGVIKDLACLDRDAKPFLRNTDRLYFYNMYTGNHKLTDRDKRRIKKIHAFFGDNHRRKRLIRFKRKRVV